MAAAFARRRRRHAGPDVRQRDRRELRRERRRRPEPHLHRHPRRRRRQLRLGAGPVHPEARAQAQRGQAHRRALNENGLRGLRHLHGGQLRRRDRARHGAAVDRVRAGHADFGRKLLLRLVPARGAGPPQGGVEHGVDRMWQVPTTLSTTLQKLRCCTRWLWPGCSFCF